MGGEVLEDGTSKRQGERNMDGSDESEYLRGGCASPALLWTTEWLGMGDRPNPVVGNLLA